MRTPLGGALFILLALQAHAAVTLPAIFSDHAIVQKSARTPVWGRAEPGEKIQITLGSARAEATTGESGRWEAVLNLANSAPGPFNLVVQGANTVTVSDVLVGEVWLASGQSNMEFTLKGTIGASQEIEASANPLLRQFTVVKGEAAIPLKTFSGKWIIASPEKSGEFTAVGYHFGKAVQRELKVPVGLIHSSWGGTPVETWTSKEALESDPSLKAGAENAETELRTYSRRLRAYLLGYPAWQEAEGRKDRSFSGVPSAADGWKPAAIPGKISEPGAVWLRCTVQVSPEHAGKSVSIGLSEWLRGTEQVYWNGTLVGSTSLEQAVKTRGDRRHTVPSAQVTAGEAVIAIRIFNAVGDISLPAAINLGKLQATAGSWEQKAEFTLPPLSSSAKAAMPVSPGVEPWSWQGPSHLYNAMIHPLIPYAIKGVIWYQGEANVARAYQYRTAFPLLIKDWRARWNQPELPFYFCQLANMGPKSAQPGDTNWAELREAQSLTLAQPHTGQAVLIDVGEANDIHPRNKQVVGARLAAIALSQTYGKAVPFSGPVYESMKVVGEKVILSFKKTGGALVAKPLPATYDVNSLAGQTAPIVRNSPESQLEGFAICGADRKWVWADAKIDGEQVVVWSSRVPAPVAVRYGWAMNPTCNLYNTAGLPASPFRTDDFPISSQTTTY
jgi:sialate O-acetylesterase